MRNRREVIFGLAGLAVIPVLGRQAGNKNEEKKEKEKKKKKEVLEHYTGVVIVTGGRMGGRTMRIDVRITDYTSDEEVQEYFDLLREGGQDKLRDLLEKKDLGNVSPSMSTGTNLAIVRAFEDQNRRILRVWTARPMGFMELYYGGRSTDYPFTLIELNVDAEGKGDGTIIGGAQVKVKDNQLEIESLGHQYLKLTNVTRYKKKD